MHPLHESDVAAITGGGKPDAATDPSAQRGQPVPVWHPIFVTDP